jgi:sulfotransferase
MSVVGTTYSGGEKVSETKTYHFLAGLPRSGNTVVSSILNQNPDFYSSPLSPVCEYMWSLQSQMYSSENVIRQGDTTGSENVISNVLPSYYKNIDKPIIFDREKNWGNAANVEMLKKYINPSPKIIYTVRPIVDVLASAVQIYTKTPKLKEEMVRQGWWFRDYLSYEDNICDYLMRPWGEIDRMMSSIDTLTKVENKDVFFIIEYDELVSSPKDVMNNLYKFLDLEPYKHDFKNIIKTHVDYEDRIGAPDDMHKVRKELVKTSTPAKEILSDYIINKYSNLEYWKTNKQ